MLKACACASVERETRMHTARTAGGVLSAAKMVKFLEHHFYIRTPIFRNSFYSRTSWNIISTL